MKNLNMITTLAGHRLACSPLAQVYIQTYLNISFRCLCLTKYSQKSSRHQLLLPNLAADLAVGVYRRASYLHI